MGDGVRRGELHAFVAGGAALEMVEEALAPAEQHGNDDHVQVVDQAGLTWLETPDQAVVWGTALGLQSDIENVLKRSIDDVQDQPQLASSTYFPAWYRTSDGSSFASGMASGSGGSIFSNSAVPDLGGMMSALGTIGNSPSSSGSGGGGFGGGGSGGGGGGAGGGF